MIHYRDAKGTCVLKSTEWADKRPSTDFAGRYSCKTLLPAKQHGLVSFVVALAAFVVKRFYHKGHPGGHKGHTDNDIL